MTTTKQYECADRTLRQLKSLTETEGWTEFFLPYVEKRMETIKNLALLDVTMDSNAIERARGAYKELSDMLEHVKKHLNYSKSVIGNDPLANSANRG
jgi:hypothetical protein